METSRNSVEIVQQEIKELSEKLGRARSKKVQSELRVQLQSRNKFIKIFSRSILSGGRRYE